MKVRIYQPASGPAQVVIPNPRLRAEGESEDEFIARIALHAEAASPVLAAIGDRADVDVSALPPDRDFRDAWRLSGGAPRVDMTAAREIHRTKLRAARAPKLAELDAEYIRELEKGGQGRPADVVTKKQTLRDLPAEPAIDAAETPDDLRAAWPEDVLGQAPYRGSSEAQRK